MSARAAARLESLGFREVYRYEGGKRDWAASGLPVEGKRAIEPVADDVVSSDVPICYPGDRIGSIRQRLEATGWDICIVVNEARVVLGRLKGKTWEAGSDEAAERVMQNGPSTFRPDVPLQELVGWMQKHRSDSVILTSQDGRLIGVVFRKTAEERLKQETEAGEKLPTS